MTVIHTIRLNGFWAMDNSANPARFTRRFGMPRMTVTGESAWLVVDGRPNEIFLNDTRVSFEIIGESVEFPLGMLPARNTLTISADVEPVAVIEIRSGA